MSHHAQAGHHSEPKEASPAAKPAEKAAAAISAEGLCCITAVAQDAAGRDGTGIPVGDIRLWAWQDSGPEAVSGQCCQQPVCGIRAGWWASLVSNSSSNHMCSKPRAFAQAAKGPCSQAVLACVQCSATIPNDPPCEATNNSTRGRQYVRLYPGFCPEQTASAQPQATNATTAIVTSSIRMEGCVINPRPRHLLIHRQGGSSCSMVVTKAGQRAESNSH